MENFHELKLLTIIFDEALKHTIETELLKLGAKGYTITPVEGRGLSGERSDPWTGTNVKIEAIVGEEVLYSVLTHLQEKYFDRYPLIAFFHDVKIVRTSHFS